MKLTGTRVFFSSLLLAFAGVVATTPAHAAQPPAGTVAQPAAQPAPAGTAPVTAQPAPAGTAPAGTAPVGPPATTEVQTTVQTTVTTPAATPTPGAKPVVMHGERRVTPPVIGAAVIGGVAVVTGVLFAVLANKDKSDYDTAATQNKAGVQDAPSDLAANVTATSGEKKAFAADICFGLGALFGLAAVALYFLPDEPAAPTTATQVTPPIAQRSAKSWMKSAVTGRLDF